MKLQIFSLIPISVLEFLAKRIHQDSMLFASITSLITKLAYFFFMDVQFKGIILIFIFFLFYFVNYMGDFYHLYIRERFYQFLVYGMGEKAMFNYSTFEHLNKYGYSGFGNYNFQEPKEHLGHLIFRNLLFFLVYLRLCLYAETYIFIAARIILIYFLLFNQFLLTAYFVSFLLITSRMVYHVTDFTSEFAAYTRKTLLVKRFDLFRDLVKYNIEKVNANKDNIDEDKEDLLYEIETSKVFYPDFFNAVLFTFLALRKKEERIRFFKRKKQYSQSINLEEIYNQLYNLNYTKNQMAYTITNMKEYQEPNFLFYNFIFYSILFSIYIFSFQLFFLSGMNTEISTL